MQKPATPPRGPKTFGTVFKIDPEGRVQMTWQTLVVLAGAIVWCTMVYTKILQIEPLMTEVQVHREVLIKEGLLPVARAP